MAAEGRGDVPPLLEQSGFQRVDHRNGAAHDVFGWGLTQSSPVSICVFGVICGSLFRLTVGKLSIR
jgi:hypothetical protein